MVSARALSLEGEEKRGKAGEGEAYIISCGGRWEYGGGKGGSARYSEVDSAIGENTMQTVRTREKKGEGKIGMGTQ